MTDSLSVLVYHADADPQQCKRLKTEVCSYLHKAMLYYCTHFEEEQLLKTLAEFTEVSPDAGMFFVMTNSDRKMESLFIIISPWYSMMVFLKCSIHFDVRVSSFKCFIEKERTLQ